MTSNTNTTTSVSYRRNRDYSKRFKWTYELNKDLYNCYTMARENPKKCYMKRMKVLWDDLYPELSYFNGKYLIQQFTYIIQRGYILETRTENEEETNVIAENLVGPSTAENDNITEMILFIVFIVNLFIVDNKNTIKKNLSKYKCSLKNMANLGQLLTKKMKIT